MTEWEKLLELLFNGKIELNNFTTTARTSKTKRTRKQRTEKDYVKIEYIRKHDSIRIYCPSFRRKVVNILIPNVSTFESLRHAFKWALENSYDHAKQLIQNHVLRNTEKIEEQLKVSNFALIRIR